MPSPQTKAGQRKLSEVARYVCKPDGIVSTAWPSVRDRLAQFGIPFDVWQQGAGRLILAKREDGIYAAGVGGVIVSIPRQVGKTYMIGWIVFALCTLVPGLTVIWTAHHTRTSNETFGKMRSMAAKASVAPYVDAVRAANGEQSVVFKNGSRILFGARDMGFGLGFDMVDILVLDEAQRVKEAAMNDMVPATNAAPNGLVIMMGTPPRPTDNGEVFTSRRKDALDGDPDTLYIELSADEGAKIVDWDQVAKANPSYPHRTGKTAILRMQKMLGSDEGFYREGYGIWESAGTSRAVSAAQWEASAIEDAPDGVPSFAVAFNLEGDRLALAGGRKHDGGVHVEIIDALEDDRGVETGLSALADWFCERNEEGKPRWRNTSGIALSGRSGAPALAQLLRDRGVPDRWLFLPSTQKYVEACSMWLEGMRGGTITHLREGQSVLDDSVAVVDVDKRGGLSATSVDGDDTPVEAVALAHWVARTSRLGQKRATERKAVFL